jgi:HAMP domain-containing protein
MTHDPLSPSEALRTPVGATVAVVSFLAFVYSLVIVAQILLGVIVAVGLSVGLYLSYRLFAALDALADAAQRIADTRELEADEASQSSARITERER